MSVATVDVEADVLAGRLVERRLRWVLRVRRDDERPLAQISASSSPEIVVVPHTPLPAGGAEALSLLPPPHAETIRDGGELTMVERIRAPRSV